jgi:hypothetical protein
MISNYGRTNVYLRGTQTWDDKICIWKLPRTIPPLGGEIGLFYDRKTEELRQKIKLNSKKVIPFRMFLLNEKKEKFVSEYLFEVNNFKEYFIILTENVNNAPMDWSIFPTCNEPAL